MTATLAIRFGTATPFDGKVFAAQIADDAIFSLFKEDWVMNNTISCSNLRTILEYATFVVLLMLESLASSIDFINNDRLPDYASKFEKCMVESVTRVSPTACHTFIVSYLGLIFE